VTGDPNMTTNGNAPDASVVRTHIQEQLVGRELELELLLAAVAAGRHVLLEGPPGTSKTTMLKAITGEWGIPLVLVEGNSELSPAKLIGHHNPSRVLKEDYSPDNFVPGPLITAMTEGGFLYIEEFNRAPEETLNTLLMAIADREVSIPRVGMIRAAPTFRVLASMNPFDNVGTLRVSRSLHDRLCRLAVGYQDAEAERGIVRLRTDGSIGDALGDRLIADAVAVSRATRTHEFVRQGSSVRGAIDLVFMARELAAMRGIDSPDDDGYPALLLDAMLVALSGRIQLDEVADATPESVLREIWEDLLVLAGAQAVPG